MVVSNKSSVALDADTHIWVKTSKAITQTGRAKGAIEYTWYIYTACNVQCPIVQRVAVFEIFDSQGTVVAGLILVR